MEFKDLDKPNASSNGVSPQATSCVPDFRRFDGSADMGGGLKIGFHGRPDAHLGATEREDWQEIQDFYGF